MLEVLFHNARYSRGTKLSIMVVLVGVAVCTVTDVSVNTQGLIAAVVAVCSTAFQQHVSIDNTRIHFVRSCIVFSSLCKKKKVPSIGAKFLRPALVVSNHFRNGNFHM